MLPFHSYTQEETLRSVESFIKGLTTKEAHERLRAHGKNALKEDKVNYFSLFTRQLKSPIIYILLIAAAISLFVGDIKDFSVITLVVVVNTIIGFFQETKAEASTRALRKMTETRVIVIRDDEEKEIPSSELTVGDIVVLHEGNVVGADIRLLETNTLFINESSITGESLPVEKDASKTLPEDTQTFDLENMLLSGTVVVKGTGKGVVVLTGKHTYLASIAQKVMEKSPDSPLTKALSSFSKKYIGVIFIFIAVIGLTMLLQNHPPIVIGYTLLAILVSAVPEGLPIVLTLALAVGSLKLSKKGVLTRQLPAVETLGSTTLIATDKTGTITKGELTVSQDFTKDISLLRHAASIANESEDGENGDPLDTALAKWLKSDFHMHRKAYKNMEIHPFDPTLKYMATTVTEKEKTRTFIKGAFEALLKQAHNSKTEIEQYKNHHDEMAENGLRVIAFGETFDTGDFLHWKIKLVGLIGFIDPPKENVADAVVAAQNAGVRIIMITGDNPLTAKAIAKQVNIFKDGDTVLAGKEVEKLTDRELLEKLKTTSVLARILPEHKYRIVKLLEKHEVVAVTGDGVNDVLALKAANLGIAMGSGTEAAKSTAKMILLKDNLSVIVEAIRGGRIIADNIRKVIYYLVTTNLSQIFLIVTSILFNLPFPLKPIHILWINLVTDGVQDKTFPFIKEEGNVMHHSPQDTNHMFFNKHQLLHILYGTFSIGLPNVLLYMYMLPKFPMAETTTTVFTSMVVAQWINGIQSQKIREPFLKNLRKSFTINPYIWLGIGIGVLLQGLVVNFFHSWFSTTPIGLTHFFLIAYVAVSIFMLIELKKWLLLFYAKSEAS